MYTVRQRKGLKKKPQTPDSPKGSIHRIQGAGGVRVGVEGGVGGEELRVYFINP